MGYKEMANTTTIVKKLKKRHEIDHLPFRLIAAEIGINVSYVYNLICHGKEPSNPEIRQKLGLSKKCMRCNRPIRDGAPREHKPKMNWKQAYKDWREFAERLCSNGFDIGTDEQLFELEQKYPKEKQT
jgi:hypothetical protein